MLPKITHNDYRRLMLLWERGVSAKRLAAATHMSPNQFHYFLSLHRDDFPRRVVHRKLTPDEMDAMVRMRSEGMTYAEIASEVGRERTVVARAVARVLAREGA
jgi:hypothetical protein